MKRVGEYRILSRCRISSYISPSIKVTVGLGVSNVTLDVKNFIVRKGV